MQKLYITSQLPVSPSDAWSVFEGEEFRQRLTAQTGLTSEVLEERYEGEVQIRKLRFVSGNDLPKLAAKALGTKRLSYEQVNRFDVGKSRLDWKVNLPMLGERVRVEGETTIAPDGEGSRRVVNGQIEVKMRLVGGQIEKVVVAEFEKSMRKAVDLAVEMMHQL